MSRSPSRFPVVVAVDAEGSADDAVDWAAAEAAARGCPLMLVHVLQLPLLVDAYGLMTLSDCPGIDEEAGRQILRAAQDRAAVVAPELPSSVRLLSGLPARALLEPSRQAGLLVLGSRGGGLRRLLAGSVAGQLTVHASCPVVVVRPRPRTAPAAGRPRVVLGVDVGGCGSAVLDFAFQAASQRGIGLVAVHAWRGDPPPDRHGRCAPAAAAHRAVTGLLHPAQDRFPDVPVEIRLVHADPATALVAESEGAALVVVGSRGRSSMRGALFGSVGRSLLQRARCPMVVVRPDGRAPAGMSVPPEWSPGRSASWE